MGNKFWGIDFGTTTTYLSTSATVGDNLIYIGRGGIPFIPSVAGFNAERLLFCEDTAVLDEEYKIRSVKYLITRGLGAFPISGISEATDLKANRYKLTSAPEGQSGQWLSVRSSIGEQKLEVGSLITGILKTMVARADLVGETASVARIGCPAMWDGAQRLRLIEYAKNAGLEVADGTLVDEPIAACINWIEQNRHRRIKGNVLIFDMGGGTLDVSFIKVEVQPGVEPKISVLSSMGKSEAGNQFDWHISKKIIDKAAGSNANLRVTLENSIGRVFDIARQMKEDLLNNESVTRTINIPGIEAISVILTADEIADSIRGQVLSSLDQAYTAIRAGLVTGMDIDKVKRDLRPQLKKNISRMPGAETLTYVDHFVLAGGMMQMPLLQKMLIQEGVDPKVISMADTVDPGLAIAKGLGTDTLYKEVNLHVPSFSFFISWKDEESGELRKRELYKAHTRLAEASAGFLGSSDFVYRFEELKNELPRYGEGQIYAETLHKERIWFDFDGETIQGVPFRFGFQKEPVLKLTSTGTFYIKDTSEYAGKTYRMDGWPIVRRIEGSINLRNDPPEDHRDEGAGPDANGPRDKY